ncbi:MAG: mechanosensitive ion channel [Myxococcota bacterium]|nr:mechanosensitive ion channel [Myxococcota bacterium]
MSFSEIASLVRRFLASDLFAIGGTKVTIATLLTSIAIIVATFVLSSVTRRIVKRAFARRGVQDQGTYAVVVRLVHYAFVALGLSVALQTAGIELGALFTAGAVFAIGFGFAMQNIAQNFVAGVILLLERAIKPGDVIEIEGEVVRVVDMGIRATVVRTRLDEDMIVPNATLVQGIVKNFTFSDPHYRLRADVGVSYDSDLQLVVETLGEVARTIEWRVAGKEPLVLLTKFGTSSVDFEVSVWCDDPWKSRIALSDLYLAVWWAFRKKSITIAFPQLDVHLDRPVSEALTRLAS